MSTFDNCPHCGKPLRYLITYDRCHCKRCDKWYSVLSAETDHVSYVPPLEEVPSPVKK